MRALAVLLALALLATSRESLASDIPPVAELVSRADDGDWNLAAVRRALPAPELVHDDGIEVHDWKEYVYDGGALRLYVSRRGDRLIAVVADTRRETFRDTADVRISARHFVHVAPPFVVAMPSRTVDRAEFETLREQSWSLDELEKRLGPPSYWHHVHGAGWILHDWVAEGLSFAAPGSGRRFHLLDWTVPPEAYDVPMEPAAATAVQYDEYLSRVPQYHRKFAALLVRERQEIEAALGAGTPSPDGRFVAAPVNLGGTYNNARTALRERGKPERLFPVDYFTDRDDYAWLDDRTVLCRINNPVSTRFSTLDAVTGRQEVVLTLPGGPRKPPFGVRGPRSFWYVGVDGERHDVVLNDGASRPRE